MPGTTVLGFADDAGPDSGWDPATGLTQGAGAAEHPNCVWLAPPGEPLQEVRARNVLIATGAYDLPVPIPGWQLPGVMGVGGLETLLKEGAFDAAPRSFVMAGSHPLLLLTAASLLRHGHTLSGLVFQGGPKGRWLGRSMPGPLVIARKASILAGALTTIARHRVPLVWNRLPTGVSRDGSLLRVDVEGGRQIRSFSADFVGLGYGFLANSQLARQAGCQARFDLRSGGWVVTHHRQQTSRRTIFVAGEQTGVSGSEAAACEGRLAALAIAAQLDPGSVSEHILDLAERRVRKWNRLGAYLRELAHHDEAWLNARLDQGSIICRCERLPAADVLSADSGQLSDLRQLKLTTRVGMGACQARLCGPLLSSLAVSSGVRPDGLTPRFPIEPINMTRSQAEME